MELKKEQYTKQEVQEMLKGLNKQVADLTVNLTTATEKAKEIDTLKKDNLNNSIKVEMLKNGLDESLFDLVVSDDLEGSKTKITKLMDLQKKQKIDNSYKPNEHKNDDAYSVAEKNKDVEGMLKSKFSKLFQ
ncbi:MAG TPA: hypothetical protein DD421_05015 [Clostridiaceae bacterium]|nr:hypothetical protein [Clostridiaceae bacterium]